MKMLRTIGGALVALGAVVGAALYASAQSSDKLWVGKPVESLVDTAPKRAALVAFARGVFPGIAIAEIDRCRAWRNVEEASWMANCVRRVAASALTDQQLWDRVTAGELSSINTDVRESLGATTLTAVQKQDLDAAIQATTSGDLGNTYSVNFERAEEGPPTAERWPLNLTTLADWATALRAQDVVLTIGEVE